MTAHTIFRVLTFVALIPITACDGLLDVDDNPEVELEDARAPEFAETLANGSLSRLSSGWDAMVALVAIASDEATFAGPNASWLVLAQGDLATPANAALEQQYPALASAYWYTAEVTSTLDSLSAAGALTNPTSLGRAYLYASIMHATVADVMTSFAPADFQESGPEIPAERMDSLHAVAADYASDGLDLGIGGALDRNLLAARAWARFGDDIRRRLTPSADTTGEGLVSDAAAAADALAALALDPGPWAVSFEYTLLGAGSSTIGQFNCAGVDGNFIPGFRYADDISITLIDPIDGVPDPTVGRLVDQIYEPPTLCVTGTLPYLGSHELRLIVAEDALANADTVTFAAQINQIRADEGLSDWTTASGVSARDMLIHERMARLYMRGRRLADLYRFGLQADEWTPGSDAVTAPGTLYPIPQSEVDLNCYLNGSCGG